MITSTKSVQRFNRNGLIKKTVLHFTVFVCVTIPATLAQQTIHPGHSTVSVFEFCAPVERTLSAGVKHSYLLKLKKAEVFYAEIEQMGIDVMVRVITPDKNIMKEIDSPQTNWGKETIEIRALDPGIYRIEVSSVKKSGAKGNYSIQGKLLIPK